MKLQGKTALVTGASRGIGRSIALGLASEGADIAINYKKEEAAAERVKKQIQSKSTGNKAITVRGSTSTKKDVQLVVDKTMKCFGKIDILINNAGILTRTPFLEIPETEWDSIIETNLKGYFLMSQAVALTMVQNGINGSIVNISSVLEKITAPNLTHYSVTKAGVSMLTKQTALELAPHGIRVNALAPGFISTDMNRQELDNKEFKEAALGDIPLGIIGQPEDITGSVVFLCSDKEARLITGTTIFIDGGRSLK